MDKSEFGKLLTKLRQRDNLTQSDLADALGVSVSAVSKWENGKNYPDIPAFAELKELFHLSYDDLYHPQQTLTNLEQGIPLLSERQKSAPSHRKSKLFIASTITILFLCVTTGFLIGWLMFSNSDSATPANETVTAETLPAGSPDFSVFLSALSRDETIHQDVHELVLLYEGNAPLTKQMWYEEFEIRSNAWWSENKNPPVKCLKIVAYTRLDAANRHDTTDFMGYSYRYEVLQ